MHNSEICANHDFSPRPSDRFWSVFWTFVHNTQLLCQLARDHIGRNMEPYPGRTKKADFLSCSELADHITNYAAVSAQNDRKTILTAQRHKYTFKA